MTGLIKYLTRIEYTWRFTVLRSIQEFFFTRMETSPLPVEGCKIQAYARRSGPLSREGSLSCHTCCDTGPRFFRSHPKDRPIQSPFTTHEGMWRIYSNPDSHGSRPTMKAHFLALVHFVAHNIAFEMNNNECVRIHSVLLIPFLCTAVY